LRTREQQAHERIRQEDGDKENRLMRTLKQQIREGIKARRWRQREQINVDTETANTWRDKGKKMESKRVD
jgi:hypothetical protein